MRHCEYKLSLCLFHGLELDLEDQSGVWRDGGRCTASAIRLAGRDLENALAAHLRNVSEHVLGFASLYGCRYVITRSFQPTVVSPDLAIKILASFESSP